MPHVFMAYALKSAIPALHQRGAGPVAGESLTARVMRKIFLKNSIALLPVEVGKCAKRDKKE